MILNQGELSVLDLLLEFLQSLVNLSSKVEISFNKFWRKAEGKSYNIVEDKDLAITVWTSADPDCGNTDSFSNQLSYLIRNAFQN